MCYLGILYSVSIEKANKKVRRGGLLFGGFCTKTNIFCFENRLHLLLSCLLRRHNIRDSCCLGAYPYLCILLWYKHGFPDSSI